MFRGKHVKLIIAVDGTCQIDAVNFTDASCQSVTKEIAAALGGAIAHQHTKPEARVGQHCGQAEREEAQ
jgi:hypothetical protein